MSGARPALVVIAKEPVPGRAKTRLCPPLSADEAARLAEAALADTLATLARIPAGRHVIALEGRPGAWLAPGFEVIEQAGGPFGERLAAAFAAVGGPALLVGMDTPQISANAIEAATRELMSDGVDAVLGAAEDGGYWTIGLRRANPAVFDDVPMSDADTAQAQRRALSRLGLRWRELERMRDVDTIADAVAVSELCPNSTFARTLAGMPWARAA